MATHPTPGTEKRLLILLLAALAGAAICQADPVAVSNGTAAGFRFALDTSGAPAATQALWQVRDATLELTSEHATSGQSVLKAAFGDHGALWVESHSQPFDWSRCRAIAFDVFNPCSNGVPLLIRIDDKDSQGFRDRYERSDSFVLPPGRVTHVVQALTNLLANNDRLMDSAELTRFGVLADHVTLYFDSFRLIPLPEKEWPKPEAPAAQTCVLDNFLFSPRTAEQWTLSGAARTVVCGQAAGVVTGQAMQVTFAASTNAASLALQGRDGQPMDWRGYRTFCFDVLNPAAEPVPLTVQIDDAGSFNRDSRYQTEEILLPAGRSTSVMVDIWRMTSLRGFRMDKGRIRQASLQVATGAVEHVLFLSNVRLCPEGCPWLPPRAASRRGPAAINVCPSADGRAIAARNEVMSGRIPGKTPEILGRELLEDPEIRPLIPIFRAASPRRLAICSHSVSISEHWSTSGALFDIAAEALKAVNPGIEYRGFHQGGMSADRAVKAFLQEMIEYKPTDTFLMVVPSPLEAMGKMIVDMQSAGSRVYVFDAVKIWGAWSPERTEEVRALCRKRNATFIELMARGYGAEGSQDWMVKDTIHMRTVGHIFYARELLKEWAKIFAAEQKQVVTPATAAATLWDPAVFAPPRSALPMLEPMNRVTIHRAVEGEYQFLHGICLVAHKGRIFACWTNSRRNEDPEVELVRGRWSDDGGKSWGPPETVAGNPQFQPSYGHGTLLSRDGKLWAFVARFDPGSPHRQINMEAFLRDDATGQWTSHGLVARQFWAHESPRPLPDGGWILGGAMGPYPGCGPGVAILDKDDVTQWQVGSLPIPYGASEYYAGETTVWADAAGLTAIVRNPIKDLALLSMSRDRGKTWALPTETNLAMAESKACAGTLSTGQRYLVYNSGNRENLVIAAGKPGAELLSNQWMLRKGRVPARYPGRSKGPQWSYPWALEQGGNLLVAYSAAKEDAELAIIPLSSLGP